MTRGPAPRGGRRLALPAVLTLLALMLAAPALHAGAWESWLYPGFISDLIATPNEVWCATREGGLLRWDRARGLFERTVREPGSIASNELSSLALDRTGRLWVGTSAGLSRLRADRSGWDLVNRFDGLPDDSVTTLLAVGDTLWIGTRRGLALWNGHLITGSLPDGNTVSFDTTFRNIAVTGIVQLGDTLWLSTRSGIGWARLSTGLQDWHPSITGLDPARLDIEDLASDGRDIISVGVGYGYTFDWATSSWRFVIGNAIDAQSSHGHIYVGSDTAVHVWSGGVLAPIPGSPRPIRKPGDNYKDYLRAVEDPSGKRFAGSAGTLFEETAGPPWTPHVVDAPPDNGVLGLSVQGSHVAASTLGGFGRYDGSSWKGWYAGVTCTLPGCDPDTTFFNPLFTFGVLADSKGRIWTGCWRIALERFDELGTEPAFTRFFRPSGPTDLFDILRTFVHGGTEDGNGDLWFGMDTDQFPDLQPVGVMNFAGDGTYVRTWDSNNSTMQGNLVKAVETDDRNRIWIGYGSAGGVDYFTPPADSAGFSALTAMNGLVVNGISAYGDSLWVLTPSDVRRFLTGGLPSEPVRELQTVAGGIDGLGLNPLATGLDGTVWIATDDGLVHIRGDGTQDRFRTADSPLASNAVRAVALDRTTGRIWVGTAAGLHRFDPAFVAPPPTGIDQLTVRLYPNPAIITGIGPELRLTGDAQVYEGAVYDLTGRRVRDFSVIGNDQIFWDGRDDHGSLVRPGIYFVRVRAGGRSATARFVLLH